MYGPDKHDGSLECVRNCSRRLGVERMIRLPGAVPKAARPGSPL